MSRPLTLAALLALGTPAVLAAAPATEAASASAHARLFALFAASDEAQLRRNPLQALQRGDLRYADRIGDEYSDAYDAAERAALEQDLRALRAIDPAALTETDRIAYRVFESQRLIELRAFTDPVVRAAIRARPINHFYGVHLGYASVASGEGAAPFRTLADYDNNLKRNRQFPAMLDRAIARFRDGLAAGIVDSKLTTRNMIEQLDLQLAQGIEGSIYYAPLNKLPAGIGAADAARLRAGYAADIRDDIRPALTRLRDFLRDTYLPRARDGVGLHAMKDGDALYAYLIERETTLPMTAEQVHALGLSEVARIRGEMAVAARQAGFAGDLPALFTAMRTDKRFQPTSIAQLTAGYAEIKRRVEARIGEQFGTLPRSPLAIRPTPDFRAKTSAGGDYEQGTVDGRRPGTFYYNGYDLPSRYTWEMETLFLHEAEPGHHFQISLAQENDSLPNFMRYGGNNAYVEGWALYAESLWRVLGMETDPWQRLGGLNDEMLRAMRLVVDSGIHHYGWSRERAIQYMLDNSPGSVTDMTAEVERYIAIPGQALGYKIGQLTILRCKAKAMAALGAKFDPRAFHAQVLMTGSLPMPILEQKIDGWIAREKAK